MIRCAAIRARHVVLVAAISFVLATSATFDAAADSAQSAATRVVTLVSRSGSQQEAAFQERRCGPNQGCGGFILYFPGAGLRKASVVRPGETVRIVGLERDKKATILVGRIATTCSQLPVPFSPVATIARRDLGFDGKFIQLSAAGRWTVRLKPGFYALSTSFNRPGPDRSSVLHMGLLGIAVSRTEPLGTRTIPRCP